MSTTIFNMHSMSESSWVEYTHPTQLDQSFSTVDKFIIRFSKPISISSLNVQNFKIMNLQDGEELAGIFRDVVPHNDYNDLGLKLTLSLTEPLSPDTEYIFYIDGLYDAAGNTQDKPHSVVFKTENSSGDLAPEMLVDSVIAVKDKTIANADIGFLLDSDEPKQYTAYMDPVDGAYNVSRDTQTIYVSFSPQTVRDATVSIRYRQISTLEVPWRILDFDFYMDEGTDWKIEISLPQVSSGTYVEPGFEYEIIAKALEDSDEEPINESFEFRLMGELENMFTSVSSVLLMSPGWSSYDVARLIYLNSSKAISINPSLARYLTQAGQDFALYSTLWGLTASGSSNAKRIMLGDLQVDIEKGMSARWEELMREAEMRLSKAKPKYARKGVNHVSPFAARDWDEEGTPRRRIGEQ